MNMCMKHELLVFIQFDANYAPFVIINALPFFCLHLTNSQNYCSQLSLNAVFFWHYSGLSFFELFFYTSRSKFRIILLYGTDDRNPTNEVKRQKMTKMAQKTLTIICKTVLLLSLLLLVYRKVLTIDLFLFCNNYEVVLWNFSII